MNPKKYTLDEQVLSPQQNSQPLDKTVPSEELSVLHRGGPVKYSPLLKTTTPAASITLPEIPSTMTVAADKQTVVILDTGIRSSISNLLYQYDFYSQDTNASTSASHGSIVASQVLASDSDVNIIMLKVAADGSETISMDAADAALDWIAKYASQLNIAAVNLSFGGSQTVTSATASSLSDEFATLANLDVAVVVAAGNSGAKNGVTALASDSNVICVSASDGQENFASFSNRANTLTDLVADGVDIIYGGTSVSGTSFAAPLVAGAIAEVKDIFYDTYGREITVKEALKLLQATGNTMNGGGYSELNLADAISAIHDKAELTLIGIPTSA